MIVFLQARLSAAFMASTSGAAAAAGSVPAIIAATYPSAAAADISATFNRASSSTSRGIMSRNPLLSRSSVLQGYTCSSALATSSGNRQVTETECSGLSLEERAAIRLERRSERESARKARAANVGRAKSVRRDGSLTENKGLEALLPPRGSPGSGAPALSGLPDLSKVFTVLGIETSCDDTAAAVVRSDGAVLGEAIAGQEKVHEPWGGVVPGLARDAHSAKMDGVVEKALSEAGMTSVADVDAVAVTVGPGLEICLRVGCEKAKSLAAEHDKPFVAVHHLEAHTLLSRKPSPLTSSSSSIDEEQEEDSTLEFPFLGLLVSGGHCQLLLCEGVGLYTVLGGTVDDALGEAYDKAARLLGLKIGGGGGPAVEALASRGNPTAYPLSVPMQARKDCNFSFAGLKNSFRMAVLRAVEDHERQLGLLLGEKGVSSRKGSEGAGVEGTASTPEESRGAALPESTRADLAASFQHTAVRHLEDKVRRAMDVVCQRPKQALCDSRQPAWRMVVPPARLCTDNGVMVAWAGVERLRKGMSNTAEGQDVYARLPLGRAARADS